MHDFLAITESQNQKIRTIESQSGKVARKSSRELLFAISVTIIIESRAVPSKTETRAFPRTGLLRLEYYSKLDQSEPSAERWTARFPMVHENFYSRA